VILLVVVVPLALIFIFSQTLSGVSDDGITFDYAVVDLDQGQVSQGFTGQLLEQLQEDGVIELTVAESEEMASRLVEDGDVQVAFVVPAGFSDAITRQLPTEIRVIGNIDELIATSVAQSIAEAYISHVRAVQLSVGIAMMNLGDADLDALVERATAFADPIVIEDISASRKELDINTFYAAGMAVLFLFFTVQFGVGGILEEKKIGTMNRLLVAPAPRMAIVVGKVLVGFIVGIASTVVLALASTYLLGADWGNAIGVGILIVAGVTSAVAIMAVVASFAKTSEQAGAAHAVVAMVLGMLGGAFFPVAQAGGIIEKLSLATPHAWFLRGLGELQSGGGVTDIWLPVLAILAFAVVTGSIAALRLSKMVAP
jgi:ABC-2 type transport system permease protein